MLFQRKAFVDWTEGNPNNALYCPVARALKNAKLIPEDAKVYRQDIRIGTVEILRVSEALGNLIEEFDDFFDEEVEWSSIEDYNERIKEAFKNCEVLIKKGVVYVK